MGAIIPGKVIRFSMTKFFFSLLCVLCRRGDNRLPRIQDIRQQCILGSPSGKTYHSRLLGAGLVAHFTQFRCNMRYVVYSEPIHDFTFSLNGLGVLCGDFSRATFRLKRAAGWNDEDSSWKWKYTWSPVRRSPLRSAHPLRTTPSRVFLLHRLPESLMVSL